MRTVEQREAEYLKKWRRARKLTLPSWWRSLAPRRGPKFWCLVEARRKESGVQRWDTSGMTYLINQLDRSYFTMSNELDDLTSALAKQYGGIDLDEDKKEKDAAARKAAEVARRTSYSSGPREYGGDGRRTSINGTQSDGFATGAKIFPSERMELRSFGSEVIRPNRPMIMLSDYSDDELEFMLSTPVKRGWTFDTYLEVIGLPRDLHEKHDAPLYAYVARAFLREKRKAHGG